jgi:NitT/TauT family transport system substrate-binding protein
MCVFDFRQAQASTDPGGAAQSILNANPKGGKIDTLTQGFELTIPFYADPTGAATRPFRVSEQNMNDTINVMVEYGGLDAKAKGQAGSFYTNEYLPK